MRAGVAVAVGCAAALAGTGAAHARPVTRGGIIWTAKPALVHHDKAVALGWTLTARGVGRRARSVPCVSFVIAEEFLELHGGKLVSTGGIGMWREPGTGCVPSAKTTVTAKTAWTFGVPPAEHEDLGPGEAVRARLALQIDGVKIYELDAVELVVASDGTAKLRTLRAATRSEK